MFRHPSYYKNLRKLARNRELQKIVDGIAASATDQAISPTRATAPSRRATGPGLKLQAREDSTVNRVAEPQASSAKLTDPQATSDKHQAPRHKRQA
jgi:hypothetical protein